jgi:TonB family protein
VSAARVFFYRRRARSAPVPSSAQAAAREAAGHLQVRRPFRLACGPEDAVPMTLGPFRPVVVIPPGLRGESLTMALAHELVHLRRRDDVAAWGEALVAALFFVHPLCALLRRRIAAAREAACDAAVLEGRRFSPRRYAQMLLDFAAPARPGARPPLALSLAAPARSLPSRLRAMKDRPTAAPRFALLSSALLLALPLLLMACADLSAPAEHATPPPPPSQTEMDRLVQQSVASIEVRKDSTRPGTPEIHVQFEPGTPEDIKQRIRRHIELRRVTDARITFGEAAENSAENRVEAFRSPRDRTSGEGRRIEIPPPSLNEELADAIASLSMYKPEGGPFQLRITLEDGTPESTREALREHLQEQLRDSDLEVVFKAPPPPTPPTPDDMLPGPQASAPPAPRPAAADTVVPFAVVEEKPRYAGAGPQGEVKYPEEAVQNEIEGTVHLQFVVTPEGGVRDVEVLRSPAEVLSEEAVRALRATDFEPGYREDRAVAVRMSIPVRFALSGPSRAERSR